MKRVLPGWIGFVLLVSPGSVEAQGRPQVRLAGSHFTALSVADLESTARWYQDLFGLTVRLDQQADSNLRVRVLEATNLTVELIVDRRARPKPARESGEIAIEHGFIKAGFFVSDINATIAALRAHGVTLEGQWLDSKPRNVIIRDPDGNAIQFFEQAP
jgi:catechol 2,3-dioxygenase-like lactoylglutathione lyase family enzyme